MNIFLTEIETTFRIDRPKIWSDKDIIEPVINNLPQDINTKMAKQKETLNKTLNKLEPFSHSPNIISNFDFYGDLSGFYQNRKGAQIVSNDWLKTYDLIESYELIGNKRSVNVFYNTSLNAALISATNHYCKTHKVDFQWLANCNSIDKEDKYNIYANYKQNWLMNEKMNGDLTSTENVMAIKQYVKQKYPKGVDLYFSNIINNNIEENNALLNFGQILCGLTVLSSGGHFILKIPAFFSSLNISLISLLSNMFKDFYIVRPATIPCTNSEVYLLGRNFIGLLPILEQKLINIMKGLILIGQPNCANYSFYQSSTRISSLLEILGNISNTIYIKGQIPMLESAIQIAKTTKDADEIYENLGPIYIEKQDKYISRLSIKRLYVEELLNTNSLSLIKGGIKKQFKTVFAKDSSPRLYYTFLNLFNKPFHYQNKDEVEAGKKIFKLLQEDIKNGLDDEEIYNNLHVNMNRFFYDIFGAPNILTEGRANSRVDDIKKIFNSIDELPMIENYIDFGCGEAHITEAVAREISAKHVVGMDIKPPKIPVTFNFVQLNPDNTTLPAENNSNQLITCFMVLHHLKNQEEYIKEFSRVLRTGGILFIREHDIQGDTDHDGKLFIDMIHGFYEVVWAKTGEQENPDYVKNYFANYKNRANWTSIIESNGFKRISNPKIDEFYNSADIRREYADGKRIKNPFYHYYAVYIKE
jgi:ubiquinone/menaquinone biosynthesis C-methylase UbiE